jgi:hypothetical protein
MPFTADETGCVECVELGLQLLHLSLQVLDGVLDILICMHLPELTPSHSAMHGHTHNQSEIHLPTNLVPL